MSSGARFFGEAEPATWSLGGESAVGTAELAISPAVAAYAPAGPETFRRADARLAAGLTAPVDFAHGGLSRSSAAVKRAFDLVGAGVLLLATLPIMALAALAIRLDGPGPVLFRQTRVGRDGEHFAIIKFRTMIDGADALKAELMGLNETHGLFKIAEEPRITRVGRWLRRTNLDELPQLINVLFGEMSLVGPRPLVVNEDAGILGADRRRLHLPPGMTGLWQTNGRSRGPLPEMIRLDHHYVAHWSLWGDIRILLRTIPLIVLRRGR